MRDIYTQSGKKLTFREAKFIEYLVAGKSEKEAYFMAGYNCINPERNIKLILSKKHIQEELDYRYQKAREENIADQVEIMQYYTDVMRGHIKDQFGLEAPLSERTKAANELAKRIIDYQHELEAADAGQDINITLNWSREEKQDESKG